jgi:hypothetical protein
MKDVGSKTVTALRKHPGGLTLGELVMIIGKFERSRIFQVLTRAESIGLVVSVRVQKAPGELEPGQAGSKFVYYLAPCIVDEVRL